MHSFKKKLRLGHIKIIDLFPSCFLIIFTNPSARAGYDTMSIFKRSLTGFNSVFLLLDLLPQPD